MGDFTSAASRDLWRLLEPIHAVQYFSPEPMLALRAAGYRGFWMGYFAGRAAPLGAVSTELVHALFYNFTFEHVAAALPAAWTFAPPQAAIDARLAGSVAALRRQLGVVAGAPCVERAATLAERAVAAAPPLGRPLFAANTVLPMPDDPLARLWHAATLLREHRGDGHVIALTAFGMGGVESHVLAAAASGAPFEVYAAARRLSPEQWQSAMDQLTSCGLLDRDGLSDSGRDLKASIEALTDELAWTAYQQFSDAEVADLVRALQPITAAVVAAGDIPLTSPMGLDLNESARLARTKVPGADLPENPAIGTQSGAAPAFEAEQGTIGT